MNQLRWLRSLVLALPLPMVMFTAGVLPARAKAATTRAARTDVAPGQRNTRRATSGRSAPVLARVASQALHQMPLRIVAFGSSSTEGIGASSRAHTYPAQLQAELARLLKTEPVEVVNRGIAGQDSEDLVKRVPEVLADRPDLVIFQTGTNDPIRGVPLDRFEALTRQTVAALAGAGVDVMMMEPQLCHVTQSLPAAAAYRDVVRKVGAEMGVPVIRRWDLMRSWLNEDLLTASQMLAPDGLHMADAGYALLAKAVAHQVLAGSGVAADGPASAGEAPAVAPPLMPQPAPAARPVGITVQPVGQRG